ncbi:MAG: diguanylate cyclase, partial [Azoarcus sp.]|nr:diguanylate cyclase [Azoarcus sp.]
MSYRFVVLLSSAAIAVIFAALGRYLHEQVERRFEAELTSNTSRLHSVYATQNEMLAQRTEALAYSIAANTEIQRLLDEGGKAVHAEGGSAGGKQAAAARRALRQAMARQWRELSTRYGVRHLHFLLPGTVSFLRMHAPDRFGDSQGELQPMLRDLERDHAPRSGFEIGRTYAGMRGAVPVMRAMPDGKKRYIGIMELGYDMNSHLGNVSEQFDVGIALLLDKKRVDALARETPSPMTKIGQHYIIAAIRPEIAEWLGTGELPPPARGKPESHLLKWQKYRFQLVTFPIDSYPGQTDDEQAPPGNVLIWRDITAIAANFALERAAVIRGALAGYAIAQLGILLLLRVSLREWERRLKQSTATIEKLLRHNALLLETAADGICGVDAEGKITFINRAALAMYGYQAAEVMGKSLHHLFRHHRPGERPPPTGPCPLTQALASGKAHEYEAWLRRRDDSYFPAQIAITPIRERGRTSGAVVVFHDVTEQRNRQEALLQLAHTDSLTGASNRRHFLDQLETEQTRQRRHGGSASLLMTDLDFFKRINDNHGHAAGDAVLSHFVQIVRQTMRRSDVIGRLGGEEFAILLPGDGIDGARELAERLRRTFEANPTQVDNVFISAT